MEKIILLTRSLLLIPGVFVVSLVLGIPEANSAAKLYDTYKRDYRVVLVDPDDEDNDNRRFFKVVSYSMRTVESSLDGQRVFLVTRDEKTEEGDKQLWKVYVDPDGVKLLRIDKEIISRAGKTIESTQQIYKNHTYQYPANSFPMQMFPYAAQNMDLTEGSITEFNIIFSPEFKPWGLFLAVDGEETITVPAGTFECIRIKVKYNKEQLPRFFKMLPSFLLDRFFPETILWVEKQEPYSMIKLQGKLEGLSSPVKAHELIKVHDN